MDEPKMKVSPEAVLALASVYGARQDEPARRMYEASRRLRIQLGLDAEAQIICSSPKVGTEEYKAAAAKIRAENTARRMLAIAKRQPKRNP